MSTRAPRGLVATAVAVPFVVALTAAAPAPAPDADVELTFTDRSIAESSGLVARDGLVVTVNDSGDSARVFTVDRATGDTVGVTRWSGEVTDVEALAPAGDGEVWVADIGDNLASRERITVTRVPFGPGDRDVDVPEYELRYPGPPQDAETLLVDPATGRLVVVTKGIFGGEVFLGPAELDPDRPNRMEAVGVARSLATDGSFFPDGRHLVVRGYGAASVYTWPGLEEVARFDLPEQQQGEGIAVDEDGVVLLSTEGVRTDVLRLRLPRAVERAVAPPPSASATPSASPTTPGATSAGAPSGDLQSSTGPGDGERDVWPWALGGVVGLVAVGVLLRSLRPRQPRG